MRNSHELRKTEDGGGRKPIIVDPLIHFRNLAESSHRTVNHPLISTKTHLSSPAPVVQPKHFGETYLGAQIAVSDWQYR